MSTARTLALALVFGHALALLQVLEPWNLRATDMLFAARDAVAPDPRLVYVELTDEGLGEEADRRSFARVIRNADRAGAILQLHDTVFRAATPDDEALAAAARASGKVILGIVGRRGPREPPAGWRIRVDGFRGSLPTTDGAVPNTPAVAAAVRGQGYLDIEADMDGVIRRAPLLLQGPRGVLPSFALLGACEVLGIAPDEIVLRPGKLVLGDIEIPIDDHGRIRINYAGPWESGTHLRFADVHDEDPAFLRDDLEGKVVLVADVSTAAQDVGSSPIDRDYPLPGVHMNVLDSILRRDFLREIGVLGMLPFEFALLALLALLARRHTVVFLLGSAVLAALFWAAAATAFARAGWILHIVRPLTILALATVLLLMTRALAEARRRAALAVTFAAYFPPALVDRLVAHPERVTLGGRRAHLTVLFSDLAGFTKRSATMSPDAVQQMLNVYFEALVEIVFEHGGTLDKFIGDGLMVFFGDPEEQPDHALRAVRAALAIQRRLGEMDGDFTTRIGINTGDVLVGNMGSPRRLSYTVLGSAVNLAARLESAAPPGGVLVSQATFDEVKAHVAATAVEPIAAKGFAEPVPAYRVDALRNAD